MFGVLVGERIGQTAVEVNNVLEGHKQQPAETTQCRLLFTSDSSTLLTAY